MRNPDDVEMIRETAQARVSALIEKHGEIARLAVKVAQALDALDLMTQCVARDKSPIEALMLSGIVTDALATAFHGRGDTFLEVFTQASQILDDGKKAFAAARAKEVKGMPIDQMVAEIMSKVRGGV